MDEADTIVKERRMTLFSNAFMSKILNLYVKLSHRIFYVLSLVLSITRTTVFYDVIAWTTIVRILALVA